MYYNLRSLTHFQILGNSSLSIAVVCQCVVVNLRPFSCTSITGLAGSPVNSEYHDAVYTACCMTYCPTGPQQIEVVEFGSNSSTCPLILIWVLYRLTLTLILDVKSITYIYVHLSSNKRQGKTEQNARTDKETNETCQKHTTAPEQPHTATKCIVYCITTVYKLRMFSKSIIKKLPRNATN